MALGKIRLDRFIAQSRKISRRDVRLILAQGRVKVDGIVARDIDLIIDQFSMIEFDDVILQKKIAYYVMLHKPVGVVSATKDDEHQTVIDLLDYPFKDELHIVGRLDLNTSGLLLLTNDSRWSERITQPQKKVAKQYLVTLQNPVTNDYIKAFADGMYFSYEDITTKPAVLEIISTYKTKVTLEEGRYHQVKRMFGRFRNPVIALHRDAIGGLCLDKSLEPCQYRMLTAEEVNLF